MEKLRFIDLFCGIGGFRVAMDEACRENDLIPECVFSSDIDKYCQDSYELNFGHRPAGDITQVDPQVIPDHDILFAGFPCQPFSYAGKQLGFEDIRGTLVFEMARAIKEIQPKVFLAENVKGLAENDGGKTLETIISILEEIGYEIVEKDIYKALFYKTPLRIAASFPSRDPLSFIAL